MTLIACPGCGHPISPAAANCPACGCSEHQSAGQVRAAGRATPNAPWLAAVFIAGPLVAVGSLVFFAVLARLPCSATFASTLCFVLLVGSPIVFGWAAYRWISKNSLAPGATSKTLALVAPLCLAGSMLAGLGALRFKWDEDWPPIAGAIIVASSFLLAVMVPALAGFAFHRWFSKTSSGWVASLSAAGLTSPAAYASATALRAVLEEPRSPGELMMIAFYFVLATLGPILAWFGIRYWLASRAVVARYIQAASALVAAAVTILAASGFLEPRTSTTSPGDQVPAAEASVQSVQAGRAPSVTSAQSREVDDKELDDLLKGAFDESAPNGTAAGSTPRPAPALRAHKE